jgi:aminomethyltransferase
MVDKGIPRRDYEIFNADNEVIGRITSGTQSPVLKQGIGMGYVAKDFAKTDTEVLVGVRNRRLKARIVKPPFIK